MGTDDRLLGEVETIIVGGGQAGLSVGRYLKKQGRPFLILEKSESIGSTWKNRYDSLVLDSFAKYSQLEDFPFEGDPMRHATKDEVVSYLKTFARHFDIVPEYKTEVIRIEKSGNTFSIITNRGMYHSKFVVLATGPFYKPFIPRGRDNISLGILQMHSGDYRNPKQLKDGPTLVVGAGNSGTEIVEELLASGREVMFSYRRKLKSVKSSGLSQWLAYRLGLAHVSKGSLLGKLIMWYTKGKPVGVDVHTLLKNPKLILVGEFKGEVQKDVSNIIWATGYQSDFSAVSISNFDPTSQKRGVTNIKGLYLLNIRWQHSKSSSHLAGVSRDAKYVVSHICRDII